MSSPIYCKCQNESCGVFFEVEKRRKYCGKSCRESAFYQRKKKRDQEPEKQNVDGEHDNG